MNLTKTRNTTKYLAIKELSDENKTYSISALCEFAGIARSAYYKWLGHVSPRFIVRAENNKSNTATNE